MATDRMRKMRAFSLGRNAIAGLGGKISAAKGFQRLGDEEGATLVETAIASVIVLAMLFGVIEMSLAAYSYHYVSDAAREATRYAAVRGSNSCDSSKSGLTNCNLGPWSQSSGNPLQVYVQTLGYPGIDGSRMTVNASWWIRSDPDNSTYVAWSSKCTGAVDGYNKPCNYPGNQVRVVVNYQFPLSIPFWKMTTLTVTSTSSLIITN